MNDMSTSDLSPYDVFPAIMDPYPYLKNFKIPGTHLSGRPVSVVLSFLNNHQIIQILTKDQSYAYRKAVELEERTWKATKIIDKYGIRQIRDRSMQIQLLYVLSFKINEIIGNRSIFYSTIRQLMPIVSKDAFDILLEAPLISSLEFKGVILDETSANEVTEILKLSGFSLESEECI